MPHQLDTVLRGLCHWNRGQGEVSGFDIIPLGIYSKPHMILVCVRVVLEIHKQLEHECYICFKSTGALNHIDLSNDSTQGV